MKTSVKITFVCKGRQSYDDGRKKLLSAVSMVDITNFKKRGEGNNRLHIHVQSNLSPLVSSHLYYKVTFFLS